MHHDKCFLGLIPKVAILLSFMPIMVQAAMGTDMPPLPAPSALMADDSSSQNASTQNNNPLAPSSNLMKEQQDYLKTMNANEHLRQMSTSQAQLQHPKHTREHNEIPATPGPLQTQTNNPLQTPSPAIANVVKNASEVPEDPVTRKSRRDRAFSDVKDDALPLTPQQIHELRKLLDSTQRAVASAPDAPPKPVSSSLVISLAPGVTPPVIRLAAGYVSSLVFVDVTGAPWPIVSYGLGNPEVFNIQWDQKSNLIMLQSVKNYATGNLAVRLFGNPTPIMLSLVTSQKEVDYRVDLQVQGRGPHANAEIVMNTLPEKANPILINLLYGLPPKDSRQ